MKIARAARKNIRAATKGIARKIRVVTTGCSSISKSCQVPNLREVYRQLGLKPNSGIFVEIGGHDGESFSNTSFLADQGWRGVYVEPIPSLCSRIRMRHFLNRVTVEPVAIGERAGTVTLHVMDTLSTTSEDTKSAYKEIDWAKAHASAASTMEVKSETLSAILARNAIPTAFDLMIIDVEGGEEAIIRELLASTWRPQVLIVELNDLHPDFTAFASLQESSRKTRNAILSDQYTQFYADAINSIFVRRTEARA